MTTSRVSNGDRPQLDTSENDVASPFSPQNIIFNDGYFQTDIFFRGFLVRDLFLYIHFFR
jgi:hypothetical protein